MRLTTSKPFLRDLKRLSSQDSSAVIAAVKLFMEDPTARALNFEKVTGRSGFFTIRSSYSVRILMEQIDRERYEAVAVGNHDYIYASYFKK
jgi:hypothetical protein